MSGMTLTSRELQVLGLLSFGMTNKQIGDALFLAPTTIKRHLKRLADKLKARDRAGLVGEGFRRGLLKPGVEIPLQRGPLAGSGHQIHRQAIPNDPATCLRALDVTEAEWVAKFDRQPEVMWQLLHNIRVGRLHITNTMMDRL